MCTTRILLQACRPTFGIATFQGHAEEIKKSSLSQKGDLLVTKIGQQAY